MGARELSMDRPLFGVHELHELGFGLPPILGSIVGAAARLIDLVSAGPYFLFREATQEIFLERFWLGGGNGFSDFDFRIQHFNSRTVATKRRKLQNG
jgi:hypothetical protein